MAWYQSGARAVLDELGAVLRALRSTDASEPATEPAPGLDRLDELLVTFAAVGLVVRTSTTGRPRAMDRACDAGMLALANALEPALLTVEENLALLS